MDKNSTILKKLESTIFKLYNTAPQMSNNEERISWLKYTINNLEPSLNGDALHEIILLLTSKLPELKQFDTNVFSPLSQPNDSFLPIDIISENKIYNAMGIIREHLYSTLSKIIIISLSEPELVNNIKQTINLIKAENDIQLNNNETKILTKLLTDEIIGLGPLELLINNNTISDILINNINDCYIEKSGKLLKVRIHFYSHEQILNIAKKIASQCGRKIDEATPYFDGRLPNGSRVHAIIPPLALDSTVISIRKFNTNIVSLNYLVELGTLSPMVAAFINIIVKANLNLIISGGTGSGKTTLLNALSKSINHSERIITIEDSAELQLQQPHTIRLETRNKSISGEGLVSQQDLIINALRMRPDRLVIGEVRGAEAFDLLQAMNTGHDGSMSTIHANNPKDCVNRLSNLVAMKDSNLDNNFILQQIASTINIIIQIERLHDGSRKITSINQLYLNKNNQEQTEELFKIHYEHDNNNRIINTKFTHQLNKFKFINKLTVNNLEGKFQQLFELEEI